MSEQNGNTNGPSRAAMLREHIRTLESDVVDVTGPSGFVYKFKKPSKFAALFQLGRLPQSAASRAVEKWIASGVIKVNDDDGEAIRNLNAVDQIFDRLLELSFDPKIVGGQPENEKEIGISEIPPGDLEYLFKWTAAGGDTSRLLDNFLKQSNGSAFAEHSGKKQRKAA